MQEPYTIYMNNNKYTYSSASDSIIYRDGQYYPATFKVLQKQSGVNRTITASAGEDIPFQEFNIDAYVSDMTIFYYLDCHNISATSAIVKCYCDDVLEFTMDFTGGSMYNYPMGSFNINKYVGTFRNTIAFNTATDSNRFTGFAWMFCWTC